MAALAEMVAQRVQQVAQSAPPKVFTVKRSGPNGPVDHQTTLLQALTDLTEEMNRTRHSNLALIGELERNRKIAKRILEKDED
jgi:hypothetical protein